MRELAVVIGRFQPVHEGHLDLIFEAIDNSDHTIIMVGSAHRPRSIINPFTYHERFSLIRSILFEQNTDQHRFTIEPLVDFEYQDYLWVTQVRDIVDAHKIGPTNVKLYGHIKDHTSTYLNYFHDWTLVDVPPTTDSNGRVIHATSIRNNMFSPNAIDPISPEGILFRLLKEKYTSEWNDLKDEWETIKEYKSRWACAPFPPTFNCADAVVVQSGHVLLVKRDHQPGRGNLALPGGFINPTETSLDAAIRELREETNLRIPEKVLRGSLKVTRLFDKPNRSVRGRTFSHTYGFKLVDEMPLPEVRGGDDAAEAAWYPINQVLGAHRSKIFEDHASIIQWVVGNI